MVVLSAGLGIAVLVACERETRPQGELILALQTDLKLPDDVSRVALQVKLDGVVKYSNAYDVGPGGVKIPATLSLVDRENAASTVSIRLVALQVDKPRVLRDVVTTVPPNRKALLRLPIQWLCVDAASLKEQPRLTADDSPDLVTTSCPTLSQTCIAGACADVNVDSSKLPDFDDGEVFGGGTKEGGGTCFDVAGCFASAGPITLDASCTFPLPGDPGELNVAVRLPPSSDGVCGPTGCFVVLDSGSASGFRVEGGRVRIPESICARNLEVVISGACAAKTEKTPSCGPWSGAATPAPVLRDAGPPVSRIDGGVVDGGPNGEVIYDELAPAGVSIDALAVAGGSVYFAKNTGNGSGIFRCNLPVCGTPQIVIDNVPERITSLVMATDRLVYRRGAGAVQSVVDCTPGGTCTASGSVFPIRDFDSVAAVPGRTFALAVGGSPGIHQCNNVDVGTANAKCTGNPVPDTFTDATAKSLVVSQDTMFWIDGLSGGRILSCGYSCGAPAQLKTSIGLTAKSLQTTTSGASLAWLGPPIDGGGDFALWECATSNCAGRPVLGSGVRGFALGQTRAVVWGRSGPGAELSLARIDLAPGNPPQILRPLPTDPTALVLDDTSGYAYYVLAENGRVGIRRYNLP